MLWKHCIELKTPSNQPRASSRKAASFLYRKATHFTLRWRQILASHYLAFLPSHLLLPLTCALLFTFFNFASSFSALHLQSGCAAPCSPLWLSQVSDERNRKHFIAGVVTPLTQPHESGRAHRRATQERFRSRQQGVEGFWRWWWRKGRHICIHVSLWVCMCVCVCWKERLAHLPGCSRVTSLHTGGQHLCTPAAAGFKIGNDAYEWLMCRQRLGPDTAHQGRSSDVAYSADSLFQIKA